MLSIKSSATLLEILLLFWQSKITLGTPTQISMNTESGNSFPRTQSHASVSPPPPPMDLDVEQLEDIISGSLTHGVVVALVWIREKVPSYPASVDDANTVTAFHEAARLLQDSMARPVWFVETVVGGKEARSGSLRLCRGMKSTTPLSPGDGVHGEESEHPAASVMVVRSTYRVQDTPPDLEGSLSRVCTLLDDEVAMESIVLAALEASAHTTNEQDKAAELVLDGRPLLRSRAQLQALLESRNVVVVGVFPAGFHTKEMALLSEACKALLAEALSDGANSRSFACTATRDARLVTSLQSKPGSSTAEVLVYSDGLVLARSRLDPFSSIKLWLLNLGLQNVHQVTLRVLEASVRRAAATLYLPQRADTLRGLDGCWNNTNSGLAYANTHLLHKLAQRVADVTFAYYDPRCMPLLHDALGLDVNDTKAVFRDARNGTESSSLRYFEVHPENVFLLPFAQQLKTVLRTGQPSLFLAVAKQLDAATVRARRRDQALRALPTDESLEARFVPEQSVVVLKTDSFVSTVLASQKDVVVLLHGWDKPSYVARASYHNAARELAGIGTLEFTEMDISIEVMPSETLEAIQSLPVILLYPSLRKTAPAVLAEKLPKVTSILDFVFANRHFVDHGNPSEGAKVNQCVDDMKRAEDNTNDPGLDLFRESIRQAFESYADVPSAASS